MHFLVFQHIDIEHPGIFCEFMLSDGITWNTVQLDVGETIPPLNDYDALIVMGGPMDVWQEAEYPWLLNEKRAIKHAIVELGLPYLGFCLGHQLMCEALGGQVSKMPRAEVGILEVELNQNGRAARLFTGLPNKFKCLQWHAEEISRLPEGCLILAESPLCKTQAFQYGDIAFGMQFHVEMLDSTVSEWGTVDEYEHSLEQTLGSGALKAMDIKTKRNMTDFNQSAKLIYNNFITQIKTNK